MARSESELQSSSGSALSKKWHGIPLWGWYVGGAAALAFAYILWKRRQTSTAVTTAGTSGTASSDYASGYGAGYDTGYGAGGGGVGGGGGIEPILANQGSPATSTPTTTTPDTTIPPPSLPPPVTVPTDVTSFLHPETVPVSTVLQQYPYSSGSPYAPTPYGGAPYVAPGGSVATAPASAVAAAPAVTTAPPATGVGHLYTTPEGTPFIFG